LSCASEKKHNTPSSGLSLIPSSQKIDSLISIGDSIRYISNAEGIKTFKKAITLSEKNNHYKLPQLYNKLGSCYFYLGDDVSCLRYFQDAYRFAEKEKSPRLMFESLSNIGIHFSNLDDKEKAIQFYKKALDIAENPENKNDSINKSVLLNSLGTLYIALQKKDSSLFYLNQALETEKIPLYKGRVYNNISNAYRTHEVYDSALFFIDEAIKVAIQLNHKSDLTFYRISKSQIYLDTKNYPRFLEEVSEANRMVDGLENAEFQIRIYDKYLDYYQGLKDYKGYHIYKTKKDSLEKLLADKKKKTHFNELVVLFDLEEKERKIDLLELSEKNKNLTIKYQKTWMTSLIIIVITLAIIFYQYLHRLKKEKQSNKMLVEKNLDLIHAEKTIRNHLNEKEQKLQQFESQLEDLKKKEKSGEDIFKENPDLKEKLIIGIQTILANPDVLCNEKLNLEFLSKKLNTNQKYISHIINDHFKSNFNNYINDKRVKYACELFTQKKYQNYTIEAIAKEVGFKNKVTFNNAFKKNTGITPSEFRKHSLSSL
jgi:AraC-like DNA-binding protein